MNQWHGVAVGANSARAMLKTGYQLLARIYTAGTRGRKLVVIIAEAKALRTAVKRLRYRCCSALPKKSIAE